MSIATLLTEFATRAEREAIFRAEWETTRAEAADDVIRDEDREWDHAVDCGLA